jgi:hypothetical protein
MAYYTVSKLEDLCNIIIPHFKSYPLLTKKHIDYILFCKVVNIFYFFFCWGLRPPQQKKKIKDI